VGGTLDSGAIVFKLGDNGYNRQFRSILSFNTGGMPDNAVIVSVTLKIRRAGQAGTNPFTTLGNIMVDIRKGAFHSNSLLESDDFQAAASKNAVLTILNKPVGSWYSGGLGPANFGYINLTGMTQFRLRFAKGDNDNSVADVLRFYSGDCATTTSYRPRLIITYALPWSPVR